MPRIRIECTLPFLLPLPDGVYADREGEPLDLKMVQADPLQRLTGYAVEVHNEDRTGVSSQYHSEAALRDDVEVEKTRKARSLVARINKLIRWYRVVSSDVLISEITLSQASPFCFSATDSNELWRQPLNFFTPPIQHRGALFFTQNAAEQTAKVRQGLSSGIEPAVEDLFLLDARQALAEGRFREAVLFSWSTIDATFSRRFDSLVDQSLGDEWGEGRKFLKGLDFGLRHRMTIGLRLVAKRSFFKEPGDLWSRLSASYERRNSIIHRGETATEIEAENAIHVAENVVRLMNEIAATAGASA